MKVFNPANQILLKEIPEDSPGQMGEKFALARRAQEDWSQLTYENRAIIIRRFRELLVAHKERLAQVLTSEVGKPITQSRNELAGVLGRIDYFLEFTSRTIADQVVYEDQQMEEAIRYEPLGVIANISAWNYPYFVGANVFVPALLTGNSVLYKPSEFSTLTGMSIAELLWEAGVPKNGFIPIIGSGSAGTEILKQPVGGVFFTGSYGTGKKISEAAAGKMTKLQLELGGKDPVYVCEDIDIHKVASGVADGAFYNTGQSCCSVERIYVHHSIYKEFLEAFVAETSRFVMGDPMDEKTYIGPLARAAQIPVLESQVDDALKKGAKLLLGGRRGKGNYFEPTVFSNVNSSMLLMREESFGPIIGIQAVQDDAEAIKMMNDTEYGLTSGVYTRNRERAERILRKINSGSVYWNCCDRVSPRLPWSGRGHSGVGSTLSRLGILAFVQPKGWHLRSA